MPASASFPSGRWRKRKRETQIARKPKPEDEEDDDEEEEDPDQEDDEVPQSAPAVPSSSAAAAAEVEVLSGRGFRISDFPLVVRHTVNRPHSSVVAVVALERAVHCGDARNQMTNPAALENISFGQLQALSAVPADTPALAAGDQDRGDGGAGAAYVITPPQIMEGRGVVKRFASGHDLVLPMHADWFSPIAVHRLERQVVPHFFSGKSPDHTPERYMEFRNRVVAKYMENPEKRLAIGDCQRVLIGVDSEDLIRIFRFLEQWGVINYCASAPNHMPWSGGTYLREDFNGEVHVPSTALKSIESLVQFDRPRCRLKAADVYPSVSGHGEDTSDLDSLLRERLSEHRCNHCSRPIPFVYYQSQKEVDVLLCSDCFHEGKFVVGHSSIDFVRMESTNDYGDFDGENWTDQETLLLLEAVEIYNDNWNEIAEHVGSKSKAQCILHFIRLPMDDGLMEHIEVPGTSGSNLSSRENFAASLLTSNGDSTGSCIQDADSGLPFANSGNPVMSLVAFLASAIGPRVAAACAHASLTVLSEDDPLATSGNIMQIEGSRHGSGISLENICSKDFGSFGDLTNSNQQKGVHHDGDVAPLSSEKVKFAAKAGLSAAAMKAKLFADHEEREIQRLSANIINHQLKRLELKLKQFAEVETLLMKECEQVERARQRFAAERARIISTRFSPTASNMPLSLPGVTVTGNCSTAANSRQQGISASPSQPMMSGFTNSQPIQHQMSFMPRQPMFGLGPRLPLAAINPSSSTPSNVMFNPPVNTQSTVSHPMLRPVSGASSSLG